jgi:hypothetical protein
LALVLKSTLLQGVKTKKKQTKSVKRSPKLMSHTRLAALELPRQERENELFIVSVHMMNTYNTSNGLSWSARSDRVSN